MGLITIYVIGAVLLTVVISQDDAGNALDKGYRCTLFIITQKTRRNLLCASIETLSFIAVKIDSIVEKEIDNILIQEKGIFLNSLCELS